TRRRVLQPVAAGAVDRRRLRPGHAAGRHPPAPLARRGLSPALPQTFRTRGTTMRTIATALPLALLALALHAPPAHADNGRVRTHTLASNQDPPCDPSPPPCPLPCSPLPCTPHRPTPTTAAPASTARRNRSRSTSAMHAASSSASVPASCAWTASPAGPAACRAAPAPPAPPNSNA